MVLNSGLLFCIKHLYELAPNLSKKKKRSISLNKKYSTECPGSLSRFSMHDSPSGLSPCVANPLLCVSRVARELGTCVTCLLSYLFIYRFLLINMFDTFVLSLCSMFTQNVSDAQLLQMNN